nr:MAG TPA: hypothetical protein [Caudoviricetes sp.]
MRLFFILFVIQILQLCYKIALFAQNVEIFIFNLCYIVKGLFPF